MDSILSFTVLERTPFTWKRAHFTVCLPHRQSIRYSYLVNAAN